MRPKMRNRHICWFLWLMISILRIRLSDAFSASLLCSKIPGLSTAQQKMCIESPDAVSSLAMGQLIAANECEYQFKGHRWNCSQVWKKDSFGHIMVVGSRETAFVYAIATAGAVHTITASCSKGNISNCGCDPMQRSTNPIFQQQAWKWGGCSADINYGMRFSRKFLDEREVEGDTRSLMNLQNNKVGRRIVKHLLRTDCKCHGVSGSCAMKTCWRTLPPFRVVGDTLMRKYNKAKLVGVAGEEDREDEAAEEEGEQREGRVGGADKGNGGGIPPVSDKEALRLVYKRRGAKTNPKKKTNAPKRLELVYIHHSPNYCDRDLSQGSMGTFGRQCIRNKTTRGGVEGCDLLCCGRGYNTHQMRKVSQCKCKFHWCCNVVCEECVERSEQYTCK